MSNGESTIPEASKSIYLESIYQYINILYQYIIIYISIYLEGCNGQPQQGQCGRRENQDQNWSLAEVIPWVSLMCQSFSLLHQTFCKRWNVSVSGFNISVGVKMHNFQLFQITPNYNKKLPKWGLLNIPTNQPEKPNKSTGMPPASRFLEFELLLQSGTDHLIRVVFSKLWGCPLKQTASCWHETACIEPVMGDTI